jgi:hypothetical protein
MNAVDAEGDSLSYDFEVYADTGLTVLVASGYGMLQQYGVTSWQVTTGLSEDQRYVWRSRANDGFEAGEWSMPATFWVNTVNQSPSGFTLVAPTNGSRLENRQPTFVWNASHDGDPFDAVTYTLAYARDSLFTQPVLIPDWGDTILTPSQPIAAGGRYYWRVRAMDEFDGIAYSTDVYSFILTTDGDANGDGAINVGDAVYIIGHVFRGGPAPNPVAAGDANGDCKVNVGDAVYLIGYVFRGGPAPQPGCAK